MTHVTFFKDSTGKHIGFSATGHSNYCEHGKDVVCAAVSTITQATIQALEEVVKANIFKQIDEANAEMFVIVDDPAKLHTAELFIINLRKTIEDISMQYPDYLALSYSNIPAQEEGGSV